MSMDLFKNTVGGSWEEGRVWEGGHLYLSLSTCEPDKIACYVGGSYTPLYLARVMQVLGSSIIY